MLVGRNKSLELSLLLGTLAELVIAQASKACSFGSLSSNLRGVDWFLFYILYFTPCILYIFFSSFSILHSLLSSFFALLGDANVHCLLLNPNSLISVQWDQVTST